MEQLKYEPNVKEDMPSFVLKKKLLKLQVRLVFEI
jgi:hypothetical protein